MKTIINTTAIFCLVLALGACSPKTTSTGSTASVNKSKLTGTWTVTAVTFDGIIENNVQSVFEQGTPQSFNGSTWVLSNSGNGSYTLANGTSQPIYWSLYNDPATGTMFQFKKVSEGEKARDVNNGFRMEIGAADANNMILKSPVQYAGKTAYVLYNFQKK